MTIALPGMKWKDGQSDAEALHQLGMIVLAVIDEEVTEWADGQYRKLRSGLLSNNEYADVIPAFLRTYRSLPALSTYLGNLQLASGATVETFVQDAFNRLDERAEAIEQADPVQRLTSDVVNEDDLRVFTRDDVARPAHRSNDSALSDEIRDRADRPSSVSDRLDVRAIDSSSWTGIQAPEIIAGVRLAKLRESLAEIEAQVSSLQLASNSDRQQVMAIITAVKILSEAPDPPGSVIRDLLGIANNIAGVGSLFVSILAFAIAKG